MIKLIQKDIIKIKFSYSLFLFWILISLNSFAQIRDDFSDLNLNLNPSWYNPLDAFEIKNEELISKYPTINSKFYISTKSTFIRNAQWEFLIKLNFNTSSANLVDIYLTSDSANLNANIKGYFLRIGNTDDDISFYKKQNGVETKLIDGVNGISNKSSSKFRIKILNTNNKWQVFIDETGGSNYVMLGEIVDNNIPLSEHFGFLIRQSTSSFFAKHIIDDIYIGPLVTDTISPKIIFSNAIDSQKIHLKCSEPILLNSVQLNDFLITQTQSNPDSVLFEPMDSSIIYLKFNTPLPLFQNIDLTIKQISDYQLNQIKDTSIRFNINITKFPVLKGQLVINEILADPEPEINLPNSEFIEIYNTTNTPIQLGECSFSDGTTTSILPNYILAADSFLILFNASNSNLWTIYDPVLALNNFPSLNNGGDHLTLKNKEGLILHEINYDLSTYHNESKQNGGYALEMIDPKTKCQSNENWRASESIDGGTPGKRNSIFGTLSDSKRPFIKHIFIKSDHEIHIHFSEAIDSNANSKINFISNIDKAEFNSTHDVLKITFQNKLDSGKKLFMEIKNFSDCFANLLDTSFIFRIPFIAKSNDIVINEILFNAPTNGYEYIEIFNTSKKPISLKGIKIGKINDGLYDEIEIDTNGLILDSNSYLAISKHSNWVRQYFSVPNNANTLTNTQLFTMDDNDGQLYIKGYDNLIWHKINYNKEWHNQFIESYDGAALEKINPFDTVQDNGNWATASYTKNYGTPGYQNSQFKKEYSGGSTLYLVDQIVSPDNDGYQDVLELHINNLEDYTKLNLKIYNSSADLIYTWISSKTIGKQETLYWNGNTNNGKNLSIGHYIVLAEFFNENGKSKIIKLPFEVMGKF